MNKEVLNYPMYEDESDLMTQQYVPEDQATAIVPDLQEIALDTIKEQSRSQGEIVVVGRLRDIAPNAKFTGKTSVDQRIAKGEITDQQMVEAVSIVRDYYVPVTEYAPMRCIEDRFSITRDEDDELGRPLGAQYPGGSAGYAIPLRISIGDIEDLGENRTTELDDNETVNEILHEVKSSAGVHNDENHVACGKDCTGCGAIDTKEGQLELYEPETIEGTAELTQALMGNTFNEADFSEAADNGLKLLDQKGYFSSGQAIIEDVRKKNAGGVETVAGIPHRAGLVIFNKVKGSTFLRDTFSDHFDDELEAHNIDLWQIDEFAEEISDDPKTRSLFSHAAYAKIAQVAQKLIAEDASLVVIIRQPV